MANVRRVIITEPLGYLEFLSLMNSARLVLTDSGGIQEETTVLNVPCLTLRENTERPVTVTHGTNRVVGTDARNLIKEAIQVLEQSRSNRPASPPLWDGHAAERIVGAVRHTLLSKAGILGNYLNNGSVYFK